MIAFKNHHCSGPQSCRHLAPSVQFGLYYDHQLLFSEGDIYTGDNIKCNHSLCLDVDFGFLTGLNLISLSG